MTTIRIIISTLLLATCFATLEIYSPSSVRDVFKEPILYTVANFGHIPFGKSLVGPLIIADPEEACQLDKVKPFVSAQNPFLLIKRGSCNFVKKVENAEKLGAKLAIIMDNVYENTAYLTMKDDGTGYRVKIPSILINIKDGEELIRQAATQPIDLKISFSNSKSDRVNLTFWLEANNRASYHVIREFTSDYEQVKDFVDLSLVYHTITCYFCRPEDCFGDGKYCAIVMEEKSLVKGRDVIRQQLREQAVFKSYPNKWWEYMDKFDLECDNLLEAAKCSAKLFDKLGISIGEIENQVELNVREMNVLAENKELLDVGGITSYPAASINNLRVPGNLKGTYLLQEICTTLNAPPSGCASVIEMPSKESSEAQPLVYHPNYGLTIALVVFIVTIFFVIAFCLYKRCLARQITTEMTSQVNDMVSKYIEFYSERANH